MRRIAVSVLALLVVLAFSGLAFSQGTMTDTTKPATAEPAKSAPVTPEAKAPVTKAPEAKAAEKPKAKAPAAHQFMGSVVSVDTTANTLVVKGKKGDVTFEVAPKAKIKVGAKAVTLGELAVGSKVTVIYKEEGGKKVATAIR